MKARMRIITTLGAGTLMAGLAAGPALASTHTVQAGDTLSGIAAQSGISLARVEAANPQIVDPNFITVGELVDVPDGTGSSAAATAPTSSAPTSSAPVSSAPVSSTPAASTGTGATSSFQQCVAWRESSNTPTDPDGLYGMLPSTWASLGYSGTAGEASVAVQNQAFQKLYAQDGTSPWAAYDGC
jgi:murein DD-endopeptidase MepM/ murein hydrolase activator NlpD